MPATAWAGRRFLLEENMRFMRVPTCGTLRVDDEVSKAFPLFYRSEKSGSNWNPCSLPPDRNGIGTLFLPKARWVVSELDRAPHSSYIE